VQRHETLRTVFHEQLGDPMQVVVSDLHIPLAVIDLRHLPEEERRQQARIIVEEEGQQPFDLVRGPLMRTALLHLSDQHNLLLITLHHIISDGWSMGILLRELQVIYTALAASRAPQLPPLPIQYADFSQWQHERLQGDHLNELVTFWRNYLHGVPELLELPLDRPRPPVKTHRGANLNFSVGAELLAPLRLLLQQAGATLFMGLLAVFGLLLHRYSGQSDIIVGTPIANRTQTELEELIGFFVNTLPLRLQFTPEMSFRALLEQMLHSTLEAYSHQELPFEKMVEELSPERRLSHTPLFQAMFVLQNDPKSERPNSLQHVPSEHSDHSAGIAKFDLTLYAVEAGGGLLASFEYNIDLFDVVSIEAMADHFRMLLCGVVTAPDAPAMDIPLEEPGRTLQRLRQRCLESTSASHQAAEAEDIARLITLQARSRGDAIAVACDGIELSYRELEHRSEQVARRLAERGIVPEQVIGVLMARTPRLVVILLGILKCGAAYLPLDAHSPAKRRAYVLKDADAALLICDQRQAAAGASVPVVDPSILEEASAENTTSPLLQAPGGADRLAYVIYTSGSTGRPKGVAVSHRSVLALTAWTRSYFSPDELGGVLASTAITFDLSVFELFATLGNGGTVVLVEDVFALLERPPQHPVKLLNTVPSAAAELLRNNVLVKGLATVCLAGEALPAHLAQGLLHQWEVRLVNLYGPTEDTVYSTAAEVRAGDDHPPAIGLSIAGSLSYVLDDALRPLPDGQPGELYLAGEGLARGYLGRSRLTAATFLPDPFAERPGTRMYRTGDRVRLLRRSGQLEFLGRRDHQLKLRGFRIEPGEVESALESHPQVSHAVVKVDRPVGSPPRLVAWLAVGGGEPPVEAELRRHLRESLPDYMIPSAFVGLERLPLTANGKVDRQALPPPPAHPAASSEDYRSPADELEQTLAEVWQQVLGIPRVGVHDNFFELGGHSLLSAQVLARLDRLLTVSPPLRALFEHPTIAELGEALRTLGAGLADTATPSPAPTADMLKEPAPPLAPPTNSHQARELLSRMDELSAEAIDALLHRLTSKMEGSL